MRRRLPPSRWKRSLGWSGEAVRYVAAAFWPLLLMPLLTIAVGTQPARAQLAWQSGRGPVVDRILMLAPREYQQQLQKAEEAIEREQYSEAIQALAELLEPRPNANGGLDAGVQEDFFVGHPGDTHLVSSLRTEARRLLGRLPARGKELYRLNYGAEAQRQLDQAMAARDEALLAEVAWRYFHTEAGYAANLLLGRHHLDRGRPLAASMCFARLAETPEAASRFDPELSLLLASSWQQAGHAQLARQTLEQLRQRLPGARFDLGGKAVNLFGEGDDPLEWLEQHLPAASASAPELVVGWQMHRGVPSRNPTSAGGAPLLRYRWRVPLAGTPDDDELIHSIVAEQREQGSAVIPSVMPLVVDDVVLVRTPENLLAVDFATGKRIWEYPWADPPLALLSGDEVPARNRQQRRYQLEERLWTDCAYGQLSSDGKCVFLIDELSYIGLGATDPATRMFRNMAVPGPDQPQEYNSLVALELETQGKYRWRVGGATGEDEPALARAFFLGAPLVLADTLYVLAEVRGDVSLFVLDAASGRLRWSQQLAHVGVMDIMQDPTRRLAGATPSYADGVLVCPTSAGGIVAVDIPTRSLLWGYQYPRSLTLSQGIRLNMIGGRVRSSITRDGEGGWLDSAALIADGRVVLTPVESDELICLDLLTGKPLWSAPRRGELLLAACIDQGRVIVLGESKVLAMSLDDGKALWELPISDPAEPTVPVGRPSGKGFLSGHRYYLPTSTRLLIIDLATGRLESATDLAEPLGTLVPYGDQIVSLSAESLTTYYQFDRLEQTVQQRLAAVADDPWAAEHLGLLQLERGDHHGALDSLRRAYRAYPRDDDRREGTRVLLVETLLAVLEQKADAAADEVIGEVDALIERPLQRERYLRLLGKRRLREGKATDAFTSFLELARQQDTLGLTMGDDPRLPLTETSSRHHLVRRDRFVRSGIRQALRLAEGAEREALDQRIVDERDQALKADQIGRLNDFLNIFADHSSAGQVRLELARRYLEVGELLRVELLLSPLLDDAPSPQVGQAWVMMARAMRSAQRAEALNHCLQALAAHWSAVPLQDGKTGAEWIGELGHSDGRPLAVVGMNAWPDGRVHVEAVGGSPSNLPTAFQAYSNYKPIELLSVTGATPTRLRIAYDSTGTNSIMISDALGRELARIPGTNGRIKLLVDGTLAAKALGHLVLINYGHGVLAANALETSPSSEQSVLWPKNYTELLDTANPRETRMQSIHGRNIWGEAHTEVQGRRVHAIGPVEIEGVVYLQGNSLHCVDPLQGQTLWVRHDLAAGSRVWGDRQVVVVTPPSEHAGVPARVFQFLDGEELDPVSVPPAERIWSTLGRMVLTWDDIELDGTPWRRLRLHDPWQGQDIWQRDCQPQTRGDLTPDGELAMVSPDDQFVLLNAHTGEVLMEQKLEVSNRVPTNVYWRTSSDQALLVRSFEPRAAEGITIESFLNDETNCPLIDGDIYAFDRPSGRLQWPAPAVIEGYGLPLDQPDDVPVLAFVRQIARSNSRSRRPTLSMLCIDKRDGRLLLEKGDLSFAHGSFFMSGDLDNRTVSLRLLNVHNYLIKFTDEPQQPAPPARIGNAAGRRKGAGLWNAIGNAIDTFGRQLEGIRAADDNQGVEVEVEVEAEVEAEAEAEEEDDTETDAETDTEADADAEADVEVEGDEEE